MQSMRSRRHSRAHRLLFLSLVGLLVGFSLWSLLLLVRAERLRNDLDVSFGWLDEVHAVREELDRAPEPDGPDARPVPGSGIDLAAFRRATEQLLRRSEDPGTGIALQNLRLALDRLAEPAGAPETSDAVWQASVAALAAAEALEAEIRGQVADLHRDLDGHWRSLWLLVTGVLLLAGSNLALLLVVHRRRVELETARSESLLSARHDPLTGLWNREGILRLLGHELVRASRSEAPLGVILADLEDFKTVNELVGHDQGDYILQQVGRRLQSLVRPYDTMGRFGGDSFLVVLPACDATATERVADRFREAVSGREVEHAFGRIGVVLNLAQMTIERAAETDVDTLLRQLQEGIDASKTSIPRPAF